MLLGAAELTTSRVTDEAPRDEARSGLRVGIVSSFMPPRLGGLEVSAETLFHMYRASGCEVRWVASRMPRTTSPREDGRIRVRSWNGFERWLGVAWPVWGLEGMRELARLVRWADVLHVHDCLYLGSAVAVWRSRRAGKPVLLSKHIGFIRYPSAILNALEQGLYRVLGLPVLRRVSHIAFCTPDAEDVVTALLGGRPVESTTILNGIDLARFRVPNAAERVAARQALGLPDSKRIALFAGRLVDYKGLEIFLGVRDRMPSRHFLVVGDGPCRPRSSQNLTWIPALSPDRMPLAYWATDALLLASNTEAFPLVMKEAMASGVPVIVPKGQAYTERLGDSGACLVVERNAEAFCDALERLWTTPGLAETLAANARELLAKNWDLEQTGAQFLALLRRLAARGSARDDTPAGVWQSVEQR